MRFQADTRSNIAVSDSNVLGLSEFDTTIIQTQIKEIVIPESNKVVYRFRDGREVEAVWQDKSRRESWSDEARQLAHDRMIQQQRRRADENSTGSHSNTSYHCLAIAR